VTRLHRAIALRYTGGPQAALIELDALTSTLDRYHLFHATRAELLRALGDPHQARDADRRALALTTNPAEQALLRQRIDWTEPSSWPDDAAPTWLVPARGDQHEA
jgi:predicted RNA polymerase sigma factor